MLRMRLAVFMHSKRWNEALDVSYRLRAVAPELSFGYIHAAFCLHELGRTSEAKALLLGGPKALQSEPTFFYNLGCYDAVLGNLESARSYLQQSFRLDGTSPSLYSAQGASGSFSADLPGSGTYYLVLAHGDGFQYWGQAVRVSYRVAGIQPELLGIGLPFVAVGIAGVGIGLWHRNRRAAS